MFLNNTLRDIIIDSWKLKLLGNKMTINSKSELLKNPWDDITCKKIAIYLRIADYKINEMADKLEVSREYLSRVLGNRKNHPLTQNLKEKFYNFYIEDIKNLLTRYPELSDIISDIKNSSQGNILK